MICVVTCWCVYMFCINFSILRLLCDNWWCVWFYCSNTCFFISLNEIVFKTCSLTTLKLQNLSCKWVDIESDTIWMISASSHGCALVELRWCGVTEMFRRAVECHPVSFGSCETCFYAVSKYSEQTSFQSDILMKKRRGLFLLTMSQTADNLASYRHIHLATITLEYSNLVSRK